MKYYVRVCSAIAFLFLLFVSVSAIGGLPKNIAYYVYEMKHPNTVHGTIDGASTPHLDAIADAAQAVSVRMKIAVLVLAILLLVAENVWRFYLAYKLKQEKKFKHYRRFSFTAIIEIIVNTVIIALASAPPTEYYEYSRHPVEYMGRVNGPILALYVFMIFWLILNYLSANQCVKDGM
ncbi:MAG: hypothetical protein J5795_01330 [Lachnospiraceae bacterium]|nr:hypothetical protein [Lachnospiraceae bacterium]